MEKRSSLKPELIRSNRCAGCGDELNGNYGSGLRRYCSRCTEVGELKEHWQPFSSGVRIVQVYTSRSKQ